MESENSFTVLTQKSDCVVHRVGVSLAMHWSLCLFGARPCLVLCCIRLSRWGGAWGAMPGFYVHVVCHGYARTNDHGDNIYGSIALISTKMQASAISFCA